MMASLMKPVQENSRASDLFPAWRTANWGIDWEFGGAELLLFFRAAIATALALLLHEDLLLS